METASKLGFLPGCCHHFLWVQARQGAPNHIGMIQLLGDLDLTLKPRPGQLLSLKWTAQRAAMGQKPYWFSQFSHQKYWINMDKC